MKSLLLFSPILLLVLSCQPKANETDQESTIITQEAKIQIDSTLSAFVSSGQAAGVSALIFEKNKEAYFNAYGFADKEAAIPMDRNTIVRIFSMTKPITGAALMKLHEEGAFELDDPISRYAPEFSEMKVFSGVDGSGEMALEPAKRAITMRDLTRHTAGFANPDHPQLGELVLKADAMNKENTLADMVKKLAAIPLSFHPGEQWSYGISVDVQAYLVERISGKPFDQYVRENILNPLEMSNTRYVVPESEIQKLAALYVRGDDEQISKVPFEMANEFNIHEWPLKPGGFGLTSTLDDYMKFAQMLVNEGKHNGVSILKEETVKLMATNHLSDSVSERMWLPSKGQVGFGIDFAVRLRPPATSEENNGVVGEFFWDGAATTLFWVDPKNELTAVFFVQIVPFYGQFHKKFRDAVYGKYKQDAEVSK
jgi:CubicO group peptidase (beta-lactamase class C family)